jgi:alanine racemase
MRAFVTLFTLIVIVPNYKSTWKYLEKFILETKINKIKLKNEQMKATNTRPILEVNLKALQENYLFAKNQLSSNTNCSAVIKANAYGIGAREAFKALRAVGCNDFYFSYFDEAYELHDLCKGNEKLYVLMPQNDAEVREVLRHNFIPVLSSLKEIDALHHIAYSSGINIPCVIQFDTGMNRIGLNDYDIESLDLNGLDALYLMSHLACADEPSHPKNKEQLDKVKKILSKLPGYKFSLCNSAGIFLGKKYHFDQARPGCMLYGINPTLEASTPALPVVSVYAKVVGVRELKKAESISYKANIVAPKGTRIATLAIGYADGYHRALSDGGSCCYFSGFRLPILGRITMDFIMVDITKVPEQYLANFSYVEVMGANITVDEIAKRAKTIGYEILTSLQNRYNRFYIS